MRLVVGAANLLIAMMFSLPAHADPEIDYSGFDALRIGWPALTEAGIDMLIESHKRNIDLAQARIAEIERGYSNALSDGGSAFSNADEVIARYEAQIEEEFREINRLALQRLQQSKALARRGQITDLPELQAVIGDLLGVSRQDQFFGRNAEAMALWHATVDLQTSFATGFLETCEKQTFDVDFALGIERQNQLLGNNIDVTPCAWRKFTGDIESQGVHYHFETCTLYGNEAWDLQISGAVTGEGFGTPMVDGEGSWAAETVFRGQNDSLSGSLRVIHETRDKPSPAPKVPNDASPAASPGTATAGAAGPTAPRKVVVHKLEMRPILLVDGRGYYGNFFYGKWLDTILKMSGSPCTPR
jgi:hypothetical protein